MKYFYNKTLNMSFDDAVEKVKLELSKEQFGVLTTIDVKETLKQKLSVEFKRYTILGACNPSFAHKALLIEDKIGTMLPCNVVVQELDSGKIDVAAVNPRASMSAVKNSALEAISGEVEDKLKRVIDSL